MTSKFCPLPWNHIASHPAGYVTLCCEADHTALKSASYDITDPSVFDGRPSFYNLKNHRLIEVLNSDSFKTARLQMLSDQEPSPCKTCFRKEELGLESKRMREIKNFPQMTVDLAKSITKDDGSIIPRIEFVELRLGNTCNLRCITCNPLSSSQWRSDYLKLSEKFSFLRDRYQLLDKNRFKDNVFELDWPESPLFWEELEKLSSYLKVIYINGGEPTLIKRHWDFLETLIDQRLAQNIELNYSINLTNVPEKAFGLWSKFKKVRISCSIDALGLKNNYIRYPCEWETVLDNFQKLKQSKVEVSITQTISVFNYDSLDEFAKFFNEHYIHYNFVNDPAYYNPAVMPKHYRDNLHHRYQNSLPRYLFSQLIKAFGSKEQDLDNATRMLEITKHLDQIRQTNFDQIFPELSKAFKL